MDFSALFHSANEQLRLDNLVSITKDVYKSISKEHWKDEYMNLSYEKWKDTVKELGYDLNRIKMNPNPKSMRIFFYVGDYYTVELFSLDPAYLGDEFTINILNVDEMKKKDFMNKEYILFFFPEWNTFAIDYFIRLYKQIEKSQLWEVFKSMYVHAQYGFDMFPEEVLEEVFTYADNTESLSILKAKGVVDKNGYLTIYRGEGERSTPIEKAYSWTLSEKVADKFANHFGRGRIYKAKVRVEQTIDYEKGRNEEEVLVRYRDIEDINITQDY